MECTFGFWLLLCYCGLLLWMLIHVDGSKARHARLVIDDKLIDGSHIVIAKSWLNRRVGLLNHASLPSGNGLWIEGATSVHTKGMLFAIDVIYLDAAGQVLHILPGVEPESTTPKLPRAKCILELAGGDAQRYEIKVGSKISTAQSVI